MVKMTFPRPEVTCMLSQSQVEEAARLLLTKAACAVNWQLIKATPFPRRLGDAGVGVILWKKQHGDFGEEHVTHIICMQEDQDAYLIWGHYGLTKSGALKDFEERLGKEPTMTNKN